MNWSFDTRPEAEEFQAKLMPLLGEQLKGINLKCESKFLVTIEPEEYIEKKHLEAVFEKMGIKL